MVIGNSFIFDPTFNGIYLHTDTLAQLTVRQMIELIRAGQGSSILLDEQPLEQREFLVLPEEADRCSVVVERNERYVICGYPDFGIDRYLQTWQESLERNGYSVGVGGLLELMLTRVFSVGDSPDRSARGAFLAMLDEYGIPIGP